jgi:heat shock protein HslJ
MPMMLGRRTCFALVLLGLVATSVSEAQSAFPYDRDMVLDVRPMRGSKRVPILAVSEGGEAQIDLWCKRGRGQAAISGDAITITIGAMNDEPCTPERAQADEQMIEALAEVTGWQQRGDVLTLNGAKSLRFRLATN